MYLCFMGIDLVNDHVFVFYGLYLVNDHVFVMDIDLVNDHVFVFYGYRFSERSCICILWV